MQPDFSGHDLAELARDELHELFIAHSVRCAFSGRRILELWRLCEIMDELLLNRAGAGHMHFLGILHVAGDLLEIPGL